MKFTPFFINSNLITLEEYLASYDSLMGAVAGNTGNSYITWSLLKELGVSELGDEFHIQSIYDFDFAKADKVADFVNGRCSHVFLILQDQIRIAESYGYRLPYDGIKNLLEKIQKPVVVAGLGANSFTGFDSEFYKQLSPELVDFLHYLSGRCVELGVRGNYTAEVLGQLGVKNAVPIGCPSYFETGKDRVIKKKAALTSDKIFFTSNYPSPLNTLAYQVCQDHQEEEIIRAIAFKASSDFFKNNLWLEKYLGKRFMFFSDISKWKTFASEFDFSLGYRVHGCSLSLNSGCLSVCCNGDSRAREMCELLKIPYMPELNPEANLAELYDSIDVSQLNGTYATLYENFSSFLERNCGMKPAEETNAVISHRGGVSLYSDYSETYPLCISSIFHNIEQKLEISNADLANLISSMPQNLLLKLTEIEAKMDAIAGFNDDHLKDIGQKLTVMENKIAEFDGILNNYNRLKKTLAARALRKLLRRNI